MAVKVRLTRTGAKNSASFRVVAADARSPRDGRFLEILGWYDPTRDGRNFDLKLDRIEHWQSKGAIISDTVKSIVKRSKKPDEKLMTAPKAVAPKPVPAPEPTPEVVEEPATEAAPEATPEVVKEPAAEVAPEVAPEAAPEVVKESAAVEEDVSKATAEAPEVTTPPAE